MILADTSVWVEHLGRRSDTGLRMLLESDRVSMHPFVMGELLLGNLRRTSEAWKLLRKLPQTEQADDEEVLDFIERHKLFGLGIGYVDAHLLASARLSVAFLWTHDKRLHEVAMKLGCAAPRAS